MRNQKAKTQSVKFMSRKNGKVITVFEESAKGYAQKLEDDPNVKSYEVNIPLDNWQQTISRVGLRKEYIDVEWTSDFLIVFQDDGVRVRELMPERCFLKAAEMEKLEISRRYWKAGHVANWMIVVMGG